MQARSCFGNRFKSFFTSIWVMRSQLSSERKPEEVDVSRVIDLPWQYWHRALDASIKIGCNPWPIMDVYLTLYLAKVAHLFIACSNYSLIGLRLKGCRFSQFAWVVWLVWMCSWWSEKATTFPIQTTRKSLFLYKQVQVKSQSLRPAEHARKELSKCLARQRAAKFGKKFASCGRDEISNKFGNFLPLDANSSSFAAIVRIWLSPIHRSSNKIAWPTDVNSPEALYSALSSSVRRVLNISLVQNLTETEFHELEDCLSGVVFKII